MPSSCARSLWVKRRRDRPVLAGAVDRRLTPAAGAAPLATRGQSPPSRWVYNDLGADYHARRNPERQTKRLVSQLEALGHHVTLQAAHVAA